MLGLSGATLAQAGLDASYDVITLGTGENPDLNRGLRIAAGGVPGGLVGASLVSRIVPKKYKMLGEIVGNFAGSTIGGQVVDRGYNAFQNRERLPNPRQVTDLDDTLIPFNSQPLPTERELNLPPIANV